MPLTVQDQIPGLYSQEDKAPGQVRVWLKIFDACGRMTYYVTEFDGEDTLFGYMVSPLGADCDELGSSSLAELKSVRNRLGLPLERDLWWNNEVTLEQVMKGERR
jgi:hypothetical protein